MWRLCLGYCKGSLLKSKGALGKHEKQPLLVPHPPDEFNRFRIILLPSEKVLHFCQPFIGFQVFHARISPNPVRIAEVIRRWRAQADGTKPVFLR